MASLRAAGEPLADAADPRLYIARTASEAVLAGLRRWLDGRGRLALVAGPPGTGTTLVLRVLEQAERARRRVLFSPFLHIDPAALERWLVSLAPRPRAPLAGDPLLVAFGLEHRGALPPLLLVDDAHAAVPATLEALGRLARERLPTLRVVLGGCAGRALHAAEAAFGEQGARFALTAWTPDELRALGATICAHPALDADARARLRGLDLGSLASDAQGSVRLLKNALTTRCARERREAPSAPDAASPAPVKVEVAAAPQSAVAAPEPERPATAAAEAAPAPAPVREPAPPSVASTPEPMPEPVREAPPPPVPRARDPQEIGAVPKFRPRPARRPEPRPAPKREPGAASSVARAPAPSAPQPVRTAPPAPAPVARSVDEKRVSVSAPPRKAEPKPAAARSAPRQADPKPSPAPPPRAARAPEPARTASPRQKEPAATKSAPPRPSATERRSALNAFIRGFAKSPRAGVAPKRKPTAVATTPEPAPRPAPPPVARPAPPPVARPAPPPKPAPRPAAPRPVSVSPPRPAPAARSTPPPRSTPRPPAPIRRHPARPARRRGAGARALYALAVCVAVAAGAGVGLFAGWQYDGQLGLPVWLESALAEAATRPAEAPAPPDVAAPPPAAAASPELRAAPAPEPERWSVHVNARPWAWIRIDGAEVGATPLVAPDVPSGAHEFEATFPDGRRERRVVEVGPDSRFVSFR